MGEYQLGNPLLALRHTAYWNRHVLAAVCFHIPSDSEWRKLVAEETPKLRTTLRASCACDFEGRRVGTKQLRLERDLRGGERN